MPLLVKIARIIGTYLTSYRMPKALIVSTSASIAFHAIQVVQGLIRHVKVCNSSTRAAELLASFDPDLVIIFDMAGPAGSAAAVAAQAGISSKPTILVCSGLQSVTTSDPVNSVRVTPPLTVTAVYKAMKALSIDGIVDQTALPIHLRRPAP